MCIRDRCMLVVVQNTDLNAKCLLDRSLYRIDRSVTYALNGTLGVMTVSYTHLDVYKRQNVEYAKEKIPPSSSPTIWMTAIVSTMDASA